MRLDKPLVWMLVGGGVAAILLSAVVLVTLLVTIGDATTVLLELVARSLELEGSP